MHLIIQTGSSNPLSKASLFPVFSFTIAVVFLCYHFFCFFAKMKLSILQVVFCKQYNGESSCFNSSEREGFGCGSCPIHAGYNWQKGKKFTLFHEGGHIPALKVHLR